jgi:hypothetical protein
MCIIFTAFLDGGHYTLAKNTSNQTIEDTSQVTRFVGTNELVEPSTMDMTSPK